MSILSTVFAAIVSFVQLSDPQFGWFADPSCSKEQNAMVIATDYINKNNFDFVIFTGDLTDSPPGIRGYAIQVSLFLESASRIKNTKVFFVPGNHDVKNTPTVKSINSYRKSFGNDYYSFTIKGKKFLVLNSSVLDSSKYVKEEYVNQHKFITNNDDAIIVFLHHSLFLKSYINDDDNYFTLPKKERAFLLLQLSPLAFVSGHLHRNVISSIQETQTQFITTTSLACPLDKSKIGLRVFRIDNNNVLTHKFISLEELQKE